MATIQIPKDLSAVKSKVLLGLTKRQLVCFGGGLLLGLPVFFLMRRSAPSGTAVLCMILAMLPFFLLALYEHDGLPLERYLWKIIQVCFLRPKHRPYRTNNFYAALERQDRLDKEVYAIVHGKAAHRNAEAAGRSGHPQSRARRSKATLCARQHSLSSDASGRDLSGDGAHIQ